MKKYVMISLLFVAPVFLYCSERSSRRNSEKSRKVLSPEWSFVKNQLELNNLSRSAPIEIPQKKGVSLILFSSPKSEGRGLSFGDYFILTEGSTPSPYSYSTR